jgi:hypothetical protein
MSYFQRAVPVWAGEAGTDELGNSPGRASLPRRLRPGNTLFALVEEIETTPAP